MLEMEIVWVVIFRAKKKKQDDKQGFEGKLAKLLWVGNKDMQHSVFGLNHFFVMLL